MLATAEETEVTTTNLWSFGDLFALYNMTSKELAAWTGLDYETITHLRCSTRTHKTGRETAILIVNAINEHRPPEFGTDDPKFKYAQLKMSDVDWPNGISDCGGQPFATASAVPEPKFCDCGIELPATRVCNYC